MSARALDVRLQEGAEARNALETAAKLAYDIWASRIHRTRPAFEHLLESERDGWREVVRYLTSEPECATCGDDLLCVDCNIADVRRLMAEIDAEDNPESEERSSLRVTVCDGCGCTQSDPCVDNEGRKCSGVKPAGLCDFCAAKAEPVGDDPLVCVYSEGELNTFLRQEARA